MALEHISYWNETGRKDWKHGLLCELSVVYRTLNMLSAWRAVKMCTNNNCKCEVGSNKERSFCLLLYCLPAQCGPDSPVRPAPKRGGVGGRVQGQREQGREEEGRTGRVRSEVATDRFGSLKSLQFNWKAAACCTRSAFGEERLSVQRGHQANRRRK